MERRIGASEADILTTQTNLANSYSALGQLDRAVQLERDVYHASRRLLGELHMDTLMSANNYASSLIDIWHQEEARALMRKTIPAARRVLGDNNENTLRMRKVYARALYTDDDATLDDLREAVTTLEDLERTARRVLGGAHPLTGGIGQNLPEARARLRARETPSPGGNA